MSVERIDLPFAVPVDARVRTVVGTTARAPARPAVPLLLAGFVAALAARRPAASRRGGNE